jgi:23S rRNA pseudouridine1911/1915/1917 synthase
MANKVALNVEGTKEYVGKRLDVVVLEVIQKEIKEELLPLMSRSFITSNIKETVLVGEKVKKPGYRVREKDEIIVDIEGLEASASKIISDREALLEYEAEDNWDGVIDIVEENEDFVVINKPAGVLVHPGVGNTHGTIANFFKGYLMSKGSYDSRLERAGIVHRLDKSVSGLMVLAKTYEAQKGLQKLFQNRKVVKMYVATVNRYKESMYTRLFDKLLDKNGESSIDELVGTVANAAESSSWVRVGGYIQRSTADRKKMLFAAKNEGNSLDAVSYISPISSDKVAVRIITGRTHQIRATLSAIGFDILDDGLYNSGSKSRPSQVNEISLQSVFMQFEFKGVTYTLRL